MQNGHVQIGRGVELVLVSLDGKKTASETYTILAVLSKNGRDR
jgi:hypothetical protein